MDLGSIKDAIERSGKVPRKALERDAKRKGKPGRRARLALTLQKLKGGDK